MQCGFPLKAREGIEVVQAEHKHSEGNARTEKLEMKSQQSEKPEVDWLAATATRRMSGNGIFWQGPR